MMKVACIGNMNNNMFVLTRYLRDYGIDATLFLTGHEPSHFHPSADTFDTSYKSYTRRIDWSIPGRFFKKTLDDINNDINGFDFFIGCGVVPAYLQKINKRLDIFIPYGSDLYSEPFFQWKSLIEFLGSVRYLRYKKYQADGIRNARYVNTDTKLDLYGKPYRRLKCKGEIIECAFPMLYLPEYEHSALNKVKSSTWKNSFDKIRNEHSLVIFHHARHVWKNAQDRASAKGNDKLIRGFALFLKKSILTDAALIMLEYGPDVNETKSLVKKLGIDKNVFWFPMMPRKEIMMGLNLSDIGTGDFILGSLLGGVNCEVMAMGKPFMHYRKEDFYKDSAIPLYSLMNVFNEESVSDAFIDYTSRPAFYQAMGETGREWLKKNCIDEPLQQYLKIIQNCSQNNAR